MDRLETTQIVIASLMEIISGKDGKGKGQFPTPDESTYLLGHRSVIDSLGLVTLIIDVEQKLSDEYGISITIADERAMSRERSPFRTVKTLSEYIDILIEEQREHESA